MYPFNEPGRTKKCSIVTILKRAVRYLGNIFEQGDYSGMTLYFFSFEGIAEGTADSGTKIGYNGQAQDSTELNAWQASIGGDAIFVPINSAEAYSALQTGVIDLYATTSGEFANYLASVLAGTPVDPPGDGPSPDDDTPPDDTPDETDAPPSNGGLQLVIPRNLGISSPNELDGATIAYSTDLVSEAALSSYFGDLGIRVEFVIFASIDEAVEAYSAGRTDVLAVGSGLADTIIARSLGGETQEVFEITTGSAAPQHVSNVALLYEAGFAREADTGGLNYWIDLNEGGMDLMSMAVLLLDSDEFTQRFGDDDAMSASQFVNVMYMNVLNRPGETAGVDYWVGQMNAGASREAILLNFAISAENVQASTVGMLHEAAPGYWDFG
ncbi:DUF4214 domain-containing protein [Mesorhizobium sp. CAU 1741]|uniref:DUF4214 domain-containing protein n=1 Tax=Mesorhizobium sp. CAU 1741 TaxID=3140366 RepID=UPI00325B8891